MESNLDKVERARQISDLVRWLRNWRLGEGAERGLRRRIDRFHVWADDVDALAAELTTMKVENKALYAEIARLPSRQAAEAFGRVRKYVAEKNG